MDALHSLYYCQVNPLYTSVLQLIDFYCRKGAGSGFLMKLQLSQPLQVSFVKARKLHARLIEAQLEAHRKEEQIPTECILQALAFAERNAHTTKSTAVYTGCPHCLRAHFMNVSVQYTLTPGAKNLLLACAPGENGHEGYYLDKDTLCKIPMQKS